MKILLVINDAPYGTEKAYNALRLAMTLQKEHPDVEIKINLMADGIFCAVPNTNTPTGYYNIERMLNGILKKGGIVRVCQSCAQARGLIEMDLIEGVDIGTMPQYSNWVVECDKVLIF
jgi:uncharacterized protein involved in oxidation of intracellular sulfur